MKPGNGHLVALSAAEASTALDVANLSYSIYRLTIAQGPRFDLVQSLQIMATRKRAAMEEVPYEKPS